MVTDSTTRTILPCPYSLDMSTGEREPNFFHPDKQVSGYDAPPLTWAQQWRFLQTLRTNKEFREEFLTALGLQSVRGYGR